MNAAKTQVQQWIETVVVGLNFCPFAKRELPELRLKCVEHSKKQEVLQALLDECAYLDAHPDTATSILILTEGYGDFYTYLELVDVAEALLAAEDYDGVYQLASFHPEYCFEGEALDDPANFTNRAPWPLLHLLREDALSTVLESYPHPEEIPARNIALAREKGLMFMQGLLNAARA